jgi:threonine dehydrogenase-like Zn-dependent dehydrogenase
MEAIVCYAPRDYRYEAKWKKPKPGANQMLIKIVACGICASDCKCWSGASMFWGGPMSPTSDKHFPAYVKPPVIPGHEFFGEVAELGQGASEHFASENGPVQVGDRVIAEQIVPCNKCRFCKSGSYYMCQVHNIFGFQKDEADGGMAQYMLIPSTAIVHKIPKEMPVEDAAIIEPLSCAIHTVNRGDIQLDDVVVIAGAGPLGLMMTQVAHLKTPKKLVVLDVVNERLELARKYGADVVVNVKTQNAMDVINKLTNNYGCDVYIETTGSPSGVVQGMEMIRKLGRFVEFSVFGSETTLDWSILGDRKELDVRGAHLSPYCYPVAIDLLTRGLVTSKGIVTHKYPLKQWDEAIAMALSLDSVKVLITP